MKVFYEKVTPPAQVLYRKICKIFESTYFIQHLQMVASKFQLIVQLTFTFPKSAIETLETGVKYAHS